MIWSFGCVFPDSDGFLDNPLTSLQDCPAACQNTFGCTHFTWTDTFDGTCWMQSGVVSQNDSIHTNDPNRLCGIICKLIMI